MRATVAISLACEFQKEKNCHSFHILVLSRALNLEQNMTEPCLCGNVVTEKVEGWQKRHREGQNRHAKNSPRCKMLQPVAFFPDFFAQITILWSQHAQWYIYLLSNTSRNDCSRANCAICANKWRRLPRARTFKGTHQSNSESSHLGDQFNAGIFRTRSYHGRILNGFVVNLSDDAQLASFTFD